MKFDHRLKKEIATDTLLKSFEAARTRRSLLKGALAGGAGVAAAAGGAGLLQMLPALAQSSTAAQSTCAVSTPTQIFSIAATAEQLAVTFYTNGLKHLHLEESARINLEAALVEEQIHHDFFVANGGTPLTGTFSFPHGNGTFHSLHLFIETQQQLEGVFDSAFLAAVKELAEQHQPRLAQIAAQVAMIESEHRAIGRQIGGLLPADNWAFAPVLVASVAAAPQVIAEAGFLSPKPGNTFEYHHVDTSNPAILFKTPVTKECS